MESEDIKQEVPTDNGSKSESASEDNKEINTSGDAGNVENGSKSESASEDNKEINTNGDAGNVEKERNDDGTNEPEETETTAKAEGDDSKTDSGEKKEDESGKPKVDDAEWEKHVLFVSGMPPGEAGSLKQLLNTTLGVGCHRIKPRVRGDTNLYVLFRSHDQMKVAETLLHNQKFLKYKLTAKVVDGPVPKKRPAPRDKRDESSKKQKTESQGQQFLEGTYEDQISFKMDDVQMKLHKVAKLLQGSYPKYGGLIFHRQLKHDGFVCSVDEFKQCPAEERFATRCKFGIGLDEDTMQPALGVRVGKGENDVSLVKNIAKVNHNYPDHVMEAAKVFEKAVQASEKAPGKSNFWHELIIRTNMAQELMFLVFVHCKQDSAADELKTLNEELKEFFENGEGKDVRLVALFTKAVCTDLARPQQQSGTMELVMGTPYLEDTVMDFKLHLLPMMYFWNGVHAAKMVCEGVEELLAPSKKLTVLEIGCGIGIIGFYLAKLAGQVLSVDVEHLVEEAKKNAERNEIKDIEHFAGKPEEMIPEMAKKISLDKACAIVIGSVNRFSTCPKAMEELRKIEQIKRIVIVTEMSTSRFSPFISLARPSSEKSLGNPFFPVKAIPVDTMPHLKNYALLVLMERICLNTLPKTIKKHPATRMRESRMFMNKKQERKVFFSKGGAANLQGGRKGRIIQRNMYDGGNMYNQYQVTAYNEYHLQNMLAEERRRRMEVEEQRRWLIQEHRRRKMEEKNVTDLISDSLKEAGVPQLNIDAAQKLKQVIAEAIKSAGVLGQEQKLPGNFYNQQRGNFSGGSTFGEQTWGHQSPGTKPFYAASQDSMYGRPGTSTQNWNTRETVQYPNTQQYGQVKNKGYSNWQPSYQTYDTSAASQRGGYRTPGKRFYS